MAVKMIDTEWSFYDSGLQKTLVRGILLCDTASDLPGIDDISGYRLTIGSKAKVIDTAAKYMMQSSGTWSIQDPANDVYTKSEIDTMLLSYLTVTDAYGINPLSEIHTSDDLDDFDLIGNYYCPSATVAATLVNCPTVLPFRLETRNLNGSTRYIQRITDGNPSTPVPNCYVRVKTQNGWSSWYQSTLTQV